MLNALNEMRDAQPTTTKMIIYNFSYFPLSLASSADSSSFASGSGGSEDFCLGQSPKRNQELGHQTQPKRQTPLKVQPNSPGCKRHADDLPWCKFCVPPSVMSWQDFVDQQLVVDNQCYEACILSKLNGVPWANSPGVQAARRRHGPVRGHRRRRAPLFCLAPLASLLHALSL